MRLKDPGRLAGEGTTHSRRPATAGPVVAAAEQGVLALQRSMGNRAVTALIQRQDDPVPPAPSPPPLLDDAAVAAAVAFYRADPARYTTTVISQMQDALHLPPDGSVTDDLAQAVATFQFADTNVPALVVDGKAGARTLPRLFVTGLAVPGEAKTFGAEAQRDVVDRWNALATPAARSAAFGEAINRRFDAVGVPRAAPVLRDLKGVDGAFDFPTWTLRLDQTTFSAQSLTQAEAGDLVDIVYHEARHCEQWFRMAQMRAGQRISAGGIAAEMGIPAPIARRAVADPIARGSVAAATAQGWFDSVYGAGAKHRDHVLAEVEAANTATDAADKALTANPTAANQGRADRARARFEKAFAAYQDLPEENDAFVVEPRAAAGITRGSPDPAAPTAPAPISGPDPENVPQPSGLSTLPEFADLSTFFADDDVVHPIASSGAPIAEQSVEGINGPNDDSAQAATA